MFCTQCGTNLPDDAQFCRKCGHPQALAGTANQNQNANVLAAGPVTGAPADAPAAVTSAPVTPVLTEAPAPVTPSAVTGATPVTPTTTSISSQTTAKPARRTKVFKTVKQVAWRLTASYLWLRFAIDGIFSGAPLHSAERLAVHHLTTYLSSVGFAPGNPDYMLPILRLGWLLAITGVNVWVFLGFWVYVLFFPITIIFILVFHEQVAQQQNVSQAGLSKSQQRSVLLPIAIGMSVAWFLLYGTSTSTKQIAVGAFFAGVVFLSLAFRAFQRARPLTSRDIAFGSWVERVGASWIQDTTRLNPPTKSAAAINERLERVMKWVLLAFVYYFRGRRGRDRIAMYILVEYVAFLIVLAFSAVLFWALTIRLTAPTALSVKQSFLFSASHFLPGMAMPDAPPGLPLWTHMGPALTAWILFVLFVGPAASLLPGRQGIYAGQVEEKCRSCRKLILTIRNRINIISKFKSTLPS